MTLIALPDIADPVLDVDPERELSCECVHDDTPCGEPAAARATAMCQVVDCDCGAWSAMVCARCLRYWKELARRDGVRLRIHPLR